METESAVEAIRGWFLASEEAINRLLDDRRIPRRILVQQTIGRLNEKATGGQSDSIEREIWSGLEGHFFELDLDAGEEVARVVDDAVKKQPLPWYSNQFGQTWLSAARHDYFEMSNGSGSIDAAEQVSRNFVEELQAVEWPVSETAWLSAGQPFEWQKGPFVAEPISELQLGEYFQEQLRTPSRRPRVGPIPTLVLVHRTTVPRDFQFWREPTGGSAVQHLLLALMLADGAFETVGTITRQVEGYLPVGITFNRELKVRWRGSQVLDEGVMDTALAVLPDVMSAPDHVQRACRRVLGSTARWDLGDRIVDLVVAMEGLLTGASSDQLSYQFRLHGALLLEEEQIARQEMYRALKRAYAERSNVLHRNAPTSWGEEDVRNLEDVARRTCLKFVERPDIDFLALVLSEGESSKTPPMEYLKLRLRRFFSAIHDRIG